MLDGLFKSEMRIQTQLRLFLNTERRSYLPELANEFGASPAHARAELIQLSASGSLANERDGRQIRYWANRQRPLFSGLRSMVRKTLRMDGILDSIVTRLTCLEAVHPTGDHSEGRDMGGRKMVLTGDGKTVCLNLTLSTIRVGRLQVQVKLIAPLL